MRQQRSAWSIVLVLSLLLGLLAACSSQKNDSHAVQPASSGAASGSTSQSAKDDSHTAPFVNGKYDPPVQMSFVPCTSDDVAYYHGETAESNILYQKTLENLGIQFKTLWTAPNKNDACKTKLLLSLSANEALPDVFYSSDMDLANKLIDSGRFMDVTEAIEQYASPEVKAILNDNPELKYPVMRDGRLMALPSASFGPNGPPIMYIRQDWLDKLQLQAPTTIDEFEAVMDAFTNRDPDGNNKKDTIGLAVTLKNYVVPFGDVLADSTALFGAFGNVPGIWEKSADGQSLQYGSIQPGMKNALAKFREWMDKGYLSKDAAQMDGATAQALFASGKAGIVFGPNWYPAWPLPDLLKVDPQARYKAYPVPAGPDGHAKRRTGSLIGGALLINKDYAHPDAVFEFAEKMREYGSNSQLWGMSDKTLAEQGYAKDGVTVQPVVYGPLPYYLDPYEQINAYLNVMLPGKPPENPGQEQLFALCKSNPICIDGQVVSMQVWSQQKDIDVTNQFMGPPTETMKTKKDFLDKLEYETYTKIIYGTLDLDAFDAFVTKWKESGGDQITAEVNAWYASNIK